MIEPVTLAQQTPIFDALRGYGAGIERLGTYGKLKMPRVMREGDYCIPT